MKYNQSENIYKTFCKSFITFGGPPHIRSRGQSAPICAHPRPCSFPMSGAARLPSPCVLRHCTRGHKAHYRLQRFPALLLGNELLFLTSILVLGWSKFEWCLKCCKECINGPTSCTWRWCHRNGPVTCKYFLLRSFSFAPKCWCTRRPPCSLRTN